MKSPQGSPALALTHRPASPFAGRMTAAVAVGCQPRRAAILIGSPMATHDSNPDARPDTAVTTPGGIWPSRPAPGGSAERGDLPGGRWPTADEVDEALDLLDAQMRIAIRRAVDAFLLDYDQDPLALEVAADAVGGSLHRRLRKALLEQGGEETLATLLAHRQPPVLIALMETRVRTALRERLAEVTGHANRGTDRRHRLVAGH